MKIVACRRSRKGGDSNTKTQARGWQKTSFWGGSWGGWLERECWLWSIRVFTIDYKASSVRGKEDLTSPAWLLAKASGGWILALSKSCRFSFASLCLCFCIIFILFVSVVDFDYCSYLGVLTIQFSLFGSILNDSIFWNLIDSVPNSPGGHRLFSCFEPYHGTFAIVWILTSCSEEVEVYKSISHTWSCNCKVFKRRGQLPKFWQAKFEATEILSWRLQCSDVMSASPKRRKTKTGLQVRPKAPNNLVLEHLAQKWRSAIKQ